MDPLRHLGQLSLGHRHGEGVMPFLQIKRIGLSLFFPQNLSSPSGTIQELPVLKLRKGNLPVNLNPPVRRKPLCRESTYVKRMGKSFIIPRDLPIFIYQNFT